MFSGSPPKAVGEPVFPHFIMTRRLPTKQLLRLGGRAIHVLKYLEKAVHPRWPMTFEVAPSANIGPARVADGIGGLGVATAPGYGKPWIAFARQKFTWIGFDERSNHLG
jgi:hypothetical protein